MAPGSNDFRNPLPWDTLASPPFESRKCSAINNGVSSSLYTACPMAGRLLVGHDICVIDVGKILSSFFFSEQNYALVP